MALNIVAWTETSVHSLSVETGRSRCLWWRRPGGSPIYLGAAIFAAQVADDELQRDLRQAEAAWGAAGFGLWDCWATRDLGRFGYRRQWLAPWYLRMPSAPTTPAELPSGLSIELVTTANHLAEFEQATWEGFEMVEAAHRSGGRFSQHAVATLDDLYYLNARLEGYVVASTIAYATDNMVGIYGLSTLPRFRRRGYATALVGAAVALRPDLPVCVQPDPPTVPLYTRMGFGRAGEIAAWDKAL